jgi:hypothetical protein
MGRFFSLGLRARARINQQKGVQYFCFLFLEGLAHFICTGIKLSDAERKKVNILCSFGRSMFCHDQPNHCKYLVKIEHDEKEYVRIYACIYVD